MSTAMNHRKRSHRSQRGREMAGAKIYTKRFSATQNEITFLNRIARAIRNARRSREAKTDI